MSPDPDTKIVRPIMRQDWRDVSFLHWRVDPAVVRRVIPPQLKPDLFDGAGWVGLVPFGIENLSTPKGPEVPWVSRFPETNVRTYVVDGAGRRGVWFLSLDAARWPAVIGARAGFGLPYYWAWMSVRRSGNVVQYTSRRLTPRGGRCRLTIGIGDPLSKPSELEVFLTARFRLFAEWRRRLYMTEISHQRWPLQKASVLVEREAGGESRDYMDARGAVGSLRGRSGRHCCAAEVIVKSSAWCELRGQRVGDSVSVVREPLKRVSASSYSIRACSLPSGRAS